MFGYDCASDGNKTETKNRNQKQKEQKMTTQITINNEAVTLNPLMAIGKTGNQLGTLIKIGDFAKLKGYDMENKEQKKLANRDYTLAKKEFYRQAKQIAALAVADDSMLATKARPVFKDGELVGVDVSHRMPSQKFAKDLKGAETAQLEEKVKMLEAKLEAAGLS